MRCPKTQALRDDMSDPPVFPDILQRSDLEAMKYLHKVLNLNYSE